MQSIYRQGHHKIDIPSGPASRYPVFQQHLDTQWLMEKNPYLTKNSLNRFSLHQTMPHFFLPIFFSVSLHWWLNFVILCRYVFHFFLGCIFVVVFFGVCGPFDVLSFLSGVLRVAMRVCLSASHAVCVLASLCVCLYFTGCGCLCDRLCLAVFVCSCLPRVFHPVCRERRDLEMWGGPERVCFVCVHVCAYVQACFKKKSVVCLFKWPSYSEALIA